MNCVVTNPAKKKYSDLCLWLKDYKFDRHVDLGKTCLSWIETESRFGNSRLASNIKHLIFGNSRFGLPNIEISLFRNWWFGVSKTENSGLENSMFVWANVENSRVWNYFITNYEDYACRIVKIKVRKFASWPANYWNSRYRTSIFASANIKSSILRNSWLGRSKEMNLG